MKATYLIIPLTIAVSTAFGQVKEKGYIAVGDDTLTYSGNASSMGSSGISIAIEKSIPDSVSQRFLEISDKLGNKDPNAGGNSQYKGGNGAQSNGKTTIYSYGSQKTITTPDYNKFQGKGGASIIRTRRYTK